ncbi:MAG: hypothetical protein AAGE52_01150 [Myxococcota bacterium]
MELEAFVAKKKELSDMISTHGKELIASAFRKVFANEDVVAVAWTQYTPYFNDGDPCTFTMGTFHVCDQERAEKDRVAGRLLPDELPEDWYDTWRSEWRVRARGVLGRAVEVKTAVPEVFEHVFGDDVVVLAMRDGDDIVFHVEEYDHE